MRMALCAIFICGSQCWPAANKGLPESVVPDILGVNIHFTGREDKQVAKIAEAGFRFVRMDLFWWAVEKTKGEYDFKEYDELVDSLAQRGIRPLFILDYGNAFYDYGLAPHTDEGRAAFARFVEASVRHFKGKGVIWELWNEPNLDMFWKPGPNPEHYVKLAEVVHRAVKKSDPTALLVGPALAGWDFVFLEKVFEKGLLRYVDAVSVHPYGSGKPEDAFIYYAKVRELIDKYAVDSRRIPVIDGEWGFPSYKGFTVDMQAKFIARKFLVDLMNHIVLGIWYDWRDDGLDPNDKEHHFGTVYHDFTEKPAYKAVQTLASELNGFRFAARLDSERDTDYLALFSNNDEMCLAAWTTGDRRKISLPVDVGKFAVVNLLGDRSEVEPRDGKLEIEISDSVQYIRPLGRSKRWALEAGWTVGVRQSRGKNGLELHITSSIDAEAPYYEFFVGSRRLSAKRTKLENVSRSKAEYVAPYVSEGSPEGKLRVVARIPGLTHELTKTVTYQNSEAPIVEVVPPNNEELMVAVSLPSGGTRTSFRGKLDIGNYEGIRLQDDSAEISLSGAGCRKIVRFRMTHRPAAIYSFTLKLTDEKGREVVRVPARRYSLVETFTDGKPGEDVMGYATVLDGDPKVGGEAKLTYAESPKEGPSSVCAKLEYKLEPGWKYVEVVPKSPIAIIDKPTSVKIWIKGQANSSPAVLRYRGSDGQTFQHFCGRLDTQQWQILTADLQWGAMTFWGGTADGVVRYPLRWQALVLIDKPSQIDPITGEVFVGPVMLCYD